MASFESFVINSILANNEFGVKNVFNLESIKSMAFDRELYPQISDLIRKEEFLKIRGLPFGSNDFEFLEIMRFGDQDRNRYAVTVYSNNALENDPQVIDIFLLC